MTDQNYTHIAVVADRSGSMRVIESDMNGGLKTFLEEQAKLPGTLAVDITIFDTEIETPYSDAAVADIQWPVIVPRGGTALYDALGSTVVRLGEKFDALPEERRPGRVLVIVVTDGQENSSKEFKGSVGAATIKEMIEKQQNEFQWGFVFLGANIDSFAVGGNLGFRPSSVMDFAPSGVGVRGMTRSLADYTTVYRGGGEAAFRDEDREDALKS